MKKYIDAELQFVRMNNRDIVTESLTVSTGISVDEQYSADRFRDDF